MANPLMSILGGSGGGMLGGPFGKIIFKVAGSIMRGESPQDCFRSLANEIPELQKFNANDLKGAAHQLCQERGIDEAKITAEIKQSISSITK